MSLLLALAIGMHISWADQVSGEVYCGRVGTIQDGRVWIVPDLSPHWLAVERISNVMEGCPK